MSKILIIDDDLDILETTGSLLEYEGFEIHSADTVEKGLEMIERIAPDLILLDVMFPEKKTRGFEAAGEIKSGIRKSRCSSLPPSTGNTPSISTRRMFRPRSSSTNRSRLTGSSS